MAPGSCIFPLTSDQMPLLSVITLLRLEVQMAELPSYDISLKIDINTILFLFFFFFSKNGAESCHSTLLHTFVNSPSTEIALYISHSFSWFSKTFNVNVSQDGHYRLIVQENQFSLF